MSIPRPTPTGSQVSSRIQDAFPTAILHHHAPYRQAEGPDGWSAGAAAGYDCASCKLGASS
jgi:hypothetical protein